MGAHAADLKKWVQQRRSAEAREKAELRDNAPEPSRALVRGLALIEFATQLRVGTSAKSEPSADALRGYARWAAVRTALRVA